MKRLGARLLIAVCLMLSVVASAQRAGMGMGTRPGGPGSFRGSNTAVQGGFRGGGSFTHPPPTISTITINGAFPHTIGTPPPPSIFGHPIGTMPGFGDPTFFHHGFNNGFVRGHHHVSGGFYNGFPAYYYPYYPMFGPDYSYYQPEPQQDNTPNVVYVPVPDPNAYRPPDSQPVTAPAPAPQAQPQPDPESSPAEPTVLVFRDGHKREVSNYAIMGETLFVFAKPTAKIALADLDIPATEKANDDRGIAFRLPQPADGHNQ